MKKALCFTLVVAGAAGLTIGNARQAGNFDRLSDSDRKIFQARFEKEIWPLMSRNGKDGCVGCHSSGKIVAALKLSGKADKDFPYLLKEGFLLLDDAGSLLARVSSKDKEQRMPLGRTPWTQEEIATLRAFFVELDKKQQKK